VSIEGTELESGAADRLIAFADAVVAIGLTLLALELPVPEGRTAEEVWHSFGDHWSEYFAFLLSFYVIARLWGAHHHVMRYARLSDERLRTLNLLWLLVIVVEPAATKLLVGEHQDTLGAHAIRWDTYAAVQVLASAAFLAMVHHMVNGGLADTAMPAHVAPRAYVRSASFVAGFGLSIPVFLVTRDGWVVWIAVPLATSLVARRRTGS
jgi:uncharacterized membrane protein